MKQVKLMNKTGIVKWKT